MRDAAGEPTGILKDNAADLVTRVVPPATLDETMAKARAALDARRVGRRHDDAGHDRRARRAARVPAAARAGRAAGPHHLAPEPRHRRPRLRPAIDDGIRRRLAAHRRHQALRRRLDGLGHGRVLRAVRGRPDDVGPADSVAGRRWRRRCSTPTPRASSSSCTPSATAPTPSCSTSSRSCSRRAGRATGARASSTRRSCATPTSAFREGSASSRRFSRATASTTCAGPKSGSAPSA